MTHPAPGRKDERAKAEHGARSDVNWDQGQGHEPYENQGTEPAAPPHGGDEFAAGDRGDLSGRNLEQLEAVKRKP